MTIVLQAILLKLKEKAFLVFAQFRSGATSPVPTSQIFNNQEKGTDELAIFGGQTRLLVSKLLSTRSPTWAGMKKARPTSFSSEQLSSVTSPSSPSATSPSDTTPPFSPRQEDIGSQEVHPSLMEYMSMFPPSAFSPGINTYPDSNLQPYSLDQSILNGVSAFPQFATNTEFAYPQMPLACSLPMRQPQDQPLGSSSQQNGFAYDPTSFDDYQQPYSATTATAASTPETAGSGDFMDLGMMMNGDNGIDEQWMSFMRESGIINPNA